eukprot:CAMPEP_0197831742 /NCGR_PEP_ID=MMETSP1437-20131217/11876_1 /TAXON_ID=49252 ORGANISM="Eucampia antarctica, Strain CCMP1452" /NCGR_SAMPLE_ID=MMETSP1437 /ASSEMBLY_ACC=CAM_ASM_001096 /LENGTH=283 /DNA_ID=CAMNT_0043434791 /DNA_START=87 /DNA_END=938 /DNA_ORIENTATION=+
MILLKQFCSIPRSIQQGNRVGSLLLSQSTRCLSAAARSVEFTAPMTTGTSVSSLNQNVRGHFMLILGKPGGGKGTISGKILKDFPSFQHLSTGDVLRQHVRNQTNIGLEAKKHMDKGSLVPDDLMIRLVMEDVKKCEANGKFLLMDGFPRNLEQAVALDKTLDVDLVVNLNIPTEIIVKRIAERWIHPASGRVYNNSYNPPRVDGKDDETGENLVQREDDKPETVRKRLEAYEKVTAPLAEFYAAKGVLKSFKGTMSDVIYPEVQDWLSDQLLDDFDDVLEQE